MPAEVPDGLPAAPRPELSIDDEPFEPASRAEMRGTDNSNRELIFFYTDVVHKPAEALKIAQQEFAIRHDVFTLDAYAWSLHASGEYAEADRQIQRALSIGTKDPQILEHAEAIRAKLASLR